MNKYLLVISKNYSGYTQSENTAINFSNDFSKLLNINHKNIIHLIGSNVNNDSIKDTLKDFICMSLEKSIKDITPKLYIYLNGHGEEKTFINQDEITSIINNAVNTLSISDVFIRPVIFFISDHCSYRTIIDKYSESENLMFDWISLSSSIDFQDSYISYDSHVMTINFLEILKSITIEQIHKITIYDFYSFLDNDIKDTFIGELQCLRLRVSDKNLFNYCVFN